MAHHIQLSYLTKWPRESVALAARGIAEAILILNSTKATTTQAAATADNS